MTRTRWIIFAILVLLVFGGLVAFNKIQTANSPKSEGSRNVYGLQESHVKLVEYVDFQCEACKAYYPTMKEIKEKYKDQVTIQIKHLPIASSHPYAKMAAGYAESAAKQGKFFEMHDKIFEGQTLWQSAADPKQYFNTYAEELGLDMDRLQSDLTSTEISAIINTDSDEARSLGATGTPTFVLNGKKIEPGNSVEEISKILDEALSQNRE